MSSRAEQKAEARAAREAAEREAAQAAVRKKRLSIFGGVLGVVAVVVVAVVLIGSAGDKEDDERDSNERIAMFDGVAQDGEWLGDPNAPVVMEEYADLQCPFCKQFATTNLEPIVTDFVKSGEVRIRLRMVSILGPDSETAARYFQAAALQNKGWQFAEAFYAKQGVEGSSYVNTEFLEARAKEAGVDTAKAKADERKPEVGAAVEEDQNAFTEAKLGGTPSFRIGQKDGALRSVEVDSLATELQKEVEKAGGSGSD